MKRIKNRLDLAWKAAYFWLGLLVFSFFALIPIRIWCGIKPALFFTIVTVVIGVIAIIAIVLLEAVRTLDL